MDMPSFIYHWIVKIVVIGTVIVSTRQIQSEIEYIIICNYRMRFPDDFIQNALSASYRAHINIQFRYKLTPR